MENFKKEIIKREKFYILNSVKNFIFDMEKLVITFPKKDFISRNLLYNDALNLLEIIYKANYEKDINKKHNYQIEALAKVNKIDFYIERAYKLKYISEQQCIKNCNKLDRINRMLYSWCNNASEYK